MQVLKTHREEYPTYGVREIGTTFNGTENLKALKRHFQHSQADSCIKKVRPKLIVIFFLTLTKRALSTAVLYFHN